MHFNAVDVIVLLAIVLIAIDGARRGFTFYTTELLALGIGAGVALSLFGVLGRLFTQLLGVGQQMAYLAASLLLLVVVHVLVQMVVQPVTSRIAIALRRSLGRVPYSIASVVPAAAVGVLITVLVVAGLVVVPAAPVRNAVSGSFTGAAVSRISALQRPMRMLLIPPAGARARGQDESS